MKVTPTAIPDVLILEPKVFGDERGFFMESFNRRAFDELIGRRVEFVQDNHSRSAKGVLRGLHYQLAPDEQGKLVRVTHGRVFDVAVDIRRSSPTYGRWVGVELSGENHRQLWLPAGMAHGFLVLSDTADFLYKTTAYYAPASERAIRWDDVEIGIAWPASADEVLVSAKDAAASEFSRCSPARLTARQLDRARRTLAGAAATAQLLVALAGQLAVLRFVGIGGETDAYIAAQAVPLVLSAVMTASLQSLWLPRFARLSSAGSHTDFRQEQAGALGQAMLALTGLTLLLWSTGRWWAPLAFPGFGQRQIERVLDLVGPLFLAGVFTAQSGLLTAIMRADGKFLRAEMTSLFAGLAALALIVTLVPRFGVDAAAWSALARSGVAYAVHLVQAGLPLRLRPSAATREVWGQVQLLFGGGLLIKTGPLVDRFWSSKAPDGGLTLLNLAQLGINAITAVLERAILVPATPELTRRLQAGDLDGMRRVYRRCLVRIAASAAVVGLTMVCAFAIWDDLMRIALRLQPFQAAEVFWAALLLVPSVFAAVGASTAAAVLYAFGDTRTATAIGVGGFAFSLVLKGMLFVLFGIKGLAAAISLYVCLVLALYHLAADRRMRIAHAARLARQEGTHDKT